MAVHVKTRRRLKILGLACLVLLIGLAAAYGIRKQQIAKRLLRDRDAGYAAFESGDYYNAMHKIGPYVRRHRDDVEALYKYTQARQNVPEPNAKHVMDAMGLYRQLLEIDPGHEGGRKALLDLYVDYGLNTEVLESTKDRDDLASQRARTVALTRLRRFDEAWQQADRYTKADPMNLQQQVLALELMHQLNRPASEIVARADQLREQHPGKPQFELLLSIAFAATGNTADAVKWAQQSSRQPLDDPDFTKALVSQLDSLGRFEEARSVLERAAQLPAGKPFLSAAIRRLLDDRQYQAVADRLASVEPTDPKADPELLALRALALLELDRRDEARPIIDALGNRNSETVATAWWRVLSTVFSDERATDKQIIEACRESIVQVPENPYFRFYLAEAYSRGGEDLAAIRELTAAHQLARSWSAPVTMLTRALVASSAPQEAVMVAQAARERAPQDSDALIAFAAATARSAVATNTLAIEEVFQVLDQVERLNPRHPQLWVMKVGLLAELGRKDEATTALRSALQVAPALEESDLLQLAAISRSGELGLDQECLEVCQKTHGMTPELALARAAETYPDRDAKRTAQVFETARASAAEPNSKQWQLASARLLDFLQDPRARDEWAKLAQSHPEDAAVQHFAVSASAVQRDRALLRASIDRLGQIIGDDGIDWKIADARWLAAGNPSEAELLKATVILNDIVRRAPEHTLARPLLADCLVKLNKIDEAIEQLFIASKMQPQANPQLLRLASLLHRKGDFERARPIISQVQQNLANASLDSIGQNEIWRSVALLMNERGDTDAAIALLESRRSLTAHPAPLDDALVALHAQRGQLTDQHAQRLLESGTPAAVAMAADFYAEHGRDAEAQQALARLDGGDAKPGRTQLVRAQYFQKHGTEAQVRHELEAAIKAAPTDPDIWRAALAYEMLNGRSAGFLAAAQRAKTAVSEDASLARVCGNADWIAPLLEDQALASLALTLLTDADDDPITIDALRLMAAAKKDDTPVAQVATKLRPIAERAPRSLALQQLLAALYLSAGQPEEAVKVASRATQMFPTEPEPARLAAQALAMAGRWPEALGAAEQWKRRLRRPSGDADALLAAGHMATGDPRQALRALEPHIAAAVEGKVDDENILPLYLHAKVVLGQAEDAAATLAPSLSRSRALRAAWMQIASQQVPDTKIAAEWLARVGPLIDTEGMSERMMLAQAWSLLSRRSNAQEHEAAAVEQLEAAAKALHSAPRSSGDDWLAVAMLYEFAGQVDAAEQAYRKALQLTPDLPIAQNNLAMVVLNKAGNLDEALTLATKAAAHQQHPMRGSFLDTLACVQAKLQKYDAAIAALNDAIRYDRGNVQWRVNLVRVLAEAGQRDKAKATLRDLDNTLGDPAQLPDQTRQQIEQLRVELE